ncbi:MAG: hypothetical protein AAGC96_01840 [Pseudomonadota bacterium]
MSGSTTVRILAGALFLGLSATGSVAQSTDPAWLDDLGVQLRSELECEPNIYINMREGVLGANKVYEARVQCLDGRMFDASRVGPDENFTIRACEIAVC